MDKKKLYAQTHWLVPIFLLGFILVLGISLFSVVYEIGQHRSFEEGEIHY
ncbi:MAG: hypothetical protein HUN05_13930 [Desulfobacter sp.]|nr:MAG: hypothetical protein HUN05_13930 [Desulfobacter sp.]